jgi:hypothetical protein
VVIKTVSSLNSRFAELKIDKIPDTFAHISSYDEFVSFINMTNQEVLSGHALANRRIKNLGISSK